jgi:hypothetical protein
MSRGFFLACLLALLPALAFAQVPPRAIKITQVDIDGNPLGPIVDLYCPASGCQEPLTVTVEDSKETYMTAIEVVQRGIYVALTSRTLGTTALIDFETGRPGATFVATRGRDRVVNVLRFIVVRDASVRAERGFDAEKQITEGAVFNRNRTPDLYLRVEVLSPERG